MFRKSVIAAVSVAVIAGAGLSAPTAASAKDGRRTAAVVGALVGIGAVIAGSALAARGDEAYEPRDDRREPPRRPHAFRQIVDAEPEAECFDKPVRRWSDRHGERIVVGYRRVCR